MKNIFLGIMLTCIAAGCTSVQENRVRGTISGLDDGTTVYVVKRIGEFGRDTVMTSKIENGTFAFTMPQEYFGQMYELRFEGQRAGASFFAENGDVVISGDVDNIYFARATGTPDNDIWTSYQKFGQEINEGRNQIFFAINKAREEGDTEAEAKYRKQTKEIDNQITNYRDSIIVNSNKSAAALYLAQIPLAMLKAHQIDSVLTYFDSSMAKNPYYVAMKERADVIRKVAPGQIAPDFVAKTPDGDDIRLSDLRGKYVVLDFWASWCLPCRAETVETQKLFEAFHDKGVEIYSFSLDSDAEAWKAAIEKDGMPWHHGSDLVGGKLSPIAQTYGIDGIPAIWLIGTDGVIIAEGVRGEKLYHICEGIFAE